MPEDGCALCGRPARERVARGALLAVTEPPELFWRGLAISVRPTQFRLMLMLMLMRFGAVASASLDLVMGQDADASALKVHISHLRRALIAQGVQASIVSIRGWGYLLDLSDL